MRILELGDMPFLKTIRPDEVDYFYIGKKARTPQPYLTFRDFRRLRRELRAGRYAFVSVSLFGCPGPVWRGSRGFFSNLAKVARAAGGHFHSFGVRTALWLLRGLDVPLVVIDRKDDPDKIPAHFFGLLRLCRRYYWRELPVKLEHGFTFVTGYMEDTSAVRNSEIFREHRHKIEPLSLSVPWRDIYDTLPGNHPKDIDVFFAGTVKGSAVRERGLALLRELAAEGVQVLAEPEARYSEEEFLTLCARARLVWSPEGHAWQCFRHYEACLAGSVPVMNYPAIWRYQPLVEGVHGFYYGPEDDDLKRAVRQALARPDLAEIARAGREHVRKHHLSESVLARVIADLGL